MEVKDLVQEYELSVELVFVTSNQNIVGGEPVHQMCATSMHTLRPNQIIVINQSSRHSEVQFVRRMLRQQSKCRTIDLAPLSWRKGKLEVGIDWHRPSSDMTH